MIEFKNVSKDYGYIKALKNISFYANTGEVLGLIGANGAGKSTSIRLMLNYISQTSGEVFLDNQKIETITSRDNKLSYIPDEPIYYEFMTVEEHFHFIQAMYKNGEYNFKHLIERFDLYDHVKKMPHALSKGNKQKVMICTAIMREFDYLIADEPFTGLDPRQMTTFKEILLELKNRGKAVILSTHLLDTIESFCDRYVMIDKGEILAFGTKDEIIKSKKLSSDMSIEQIYLLLTEKRSNYCE